MHSFLRPQGLCTLTRHALSLPTLLLPPQGTRGHPRGQAWGFLDLLATIGVKPAGSGGGVPLPPAAGCAESCVAQAC